MASILHALDGVMDWLLRTSLQAGMLAILLLAINAMLRRLLPASARYALLLLVAGRLLMPFAPQSRFSIFNLYAGSPAAAKTELVANAQTTDGWVITKQPLSESVVSSSTHLPTQSSARAPFHWKDVAAAIWVAGILLMAFRIACANVKLSRKLRSAQLLTDPNLLRLLQSCKSQMRVHRTLPILETDAIQSPALMGFFRPRL